MSRPIYFGRDFFLSEKMVQTYNHYFLVSEQESNQRNQHRRGVNAALPRVKYTLSYVPLPWRTWYLLCTLTI